MPSWSILSQCFNECSVILEANNYFNGMRIIIEGISDTRDDLFSMGLVLEDGIKSFLSSSTINYRSAIPDHSPISFAFFPSSSSIDSYSSFIMCALLIFFIILVVDHYIENSTDVNGRWVSFHALSHFCLNLFLHPFLF